MPQAGFADVIWVISDTHLTRSSSLPNEFIRRIESEDVIIHLGDIISFEVMEFLQNRCHLEAIRGNCDMPDVRRNLKSRKVIEFNNVKIGLMHGQGGQAQTFEMVRHEFAGKVDVALFGHTHLPHQSRENGTLFLNPGSLGNSREGINTYGILHLDPQPWGEIIEI